MIFLCIIEQWAACNFTFIHWALNVCINGLIIWEFILNALLLLANDGAAYAQCQLLAILSAINLTAHSPMTIQIPYLFI